MYSIIIILHSKHDIVLHNSSIITCMQAFIYLWFFSKEGHKQQTEYGGLVNMKGRCSGVDVVLRCFPKGDHALYSKHFSWALVSEAAGLYYNEFL